MNHLPRVTLLFAAPEFFSTPPRKLRIEDVPVADRTYILKGDRIVAVAATQEDAR